MSLTLKHLNGDTSWLITYNQFQILIDPWLFGSQSDYFRLFSTQEHSIVPSVQNLDDVQIDAIIISHEFTDHCHEETLRSLSKTVPVFANHNAFQRIRKWNYFDRVYEIPLLNNRFHNLTLSKLTKDERMPNTISIGYIPEKGLMSLPSLHGVTSISFLSNDNQWHTLLYIPHGCKLTSILHSLHEQSNVIVSVLLQGFNRVSNPIWLGGLLNYGCDQAAQIAVAVQARHWISTHDEDKTATGLVSKFLERDFCTIDQAQSQLQKYLLGKDSMTKIHLVENGDSLIIDL